MKDNPLAIAFMEEGNTTHNRYFPEFGTLIETVERVLEHLSQVPKDILSLMSEYRKSFEDLQFSVVA